MLIRLFPLKEVKPSSDRYKVIKFLTLTCFYHYESTTFSLKLVVEWRWLNIFPPKWRWFTCSLYFILLGKSRSRQSVLVLKPKALSDNELEPSWKKPWHSCYVWKQSSLHSKLALRAKHDWRRSHNVFTYVFVWFCSYKELQYQTNTVNVSVYKSINIILSFVECKIRYVVSLDMIFLKQNLPVQKWFHIIFFNMTLQLMNRLTFKNFFHRES